MQSIKEALSHLEEIISWAKENNTPVACFTTALYSVLRVIDRYISKGKFENGARMEQFSLLFSQRYVESFRAWRDGTPVNESWKMAFDLAHQGNLTVLQNILIGLSVHVNYDLGIVAAQIRPGDSIFGLKKDFNTLQDIWSKNLLDQHDAIGRIWPVFPSFYWPYRNDEHSLVFFSLREARAYAWKNATTLALAPSASVRSVIEENIDGQVAMLNQRIAFPRKRWFTFWLWVMRRGEQGTINEKIDTLLGNDPVEST